jgi:hypothetical protein
MNSVDSCYQLIERKIRQLGEATIHEDHEHIETIAKHIINQLTSGNNNNNNNNDGILFKWCRKLKTTSKLPKQKLYVLLFKNLFGRNVKPSETFSRIQSSVRNTVMYSLRSSLSSKARMGNSVYKVPSSSLGRFAMSLKKKASIRMQFQTASPSLGVKYFIYKLKQAGLKRLSSMIIKEKNIRDLFTITFHNVEKYNSDTVFNEVNEVPFVKIEMNSMKKIKLMCNNEDSCGMAYSFVPVSHKKIFEIKNFEMCNCFNKEDIAVPRYHVDGFANTEINFVNNCKLDYKVNLLPLKINRNEEQPLLFANNILRNISEVVIFNSNTIHENNIGNIEPPKVVPHFELDIYQVDKCNLNEVINSNNQV